MTGFSPQRAFTQSSEHAKGRGIFQDRRDAEIGEGKKKKKKSRARKKMFGFATEFFFDP